MSGSEWVTTPLLFSGSLRSFLYSSSMYSCHLFLISSASIMSLSFLSFIVMIFGWNVPLMFPTFLKRCLIFPLLLFSSLCIVHWRRLSCLSLVFFGTQHLVGCTFPFLPYFLLLFFLQLFIKSPQTTSRPSCISFSLGWFPPLLPVQCSSRTSVHSFSGVLFTRSNPLNLYITSTLYSWWIWFKSVPDCPSSFPHFLYFKPEVCYRELMIWATVISGSYFLLTDFSFSIFGYKECDQSEFGIDHLVMSMCKVISYVVEKGGSLWLVYSLGRILLTFALLHFVLQGQTCLLLQASLDFLFLPSNPLWWKGHLFLLLVLEGLIGLHRTGQLHLLWHQWLGHRLGLLWCWMVCLGNESRTFCRFWGCTQVLHFGLLLIVRATPLLLWDSCPQ